MNTTITIQSLAANGLRKYGLATTDSGEQVYVPSRFCSDLQVGDVLPATIREQDQRMIDGKPSPRFVVMAINQSRFENRNKRRVHKAHLLSNGVSVYATPNIVPRTRS